MKFGENLQGHITHEWRTQYIDYERLKDVLYEFKENAPAEDSVEKSEIERYFQQSSESFFQEIEKELQKVNLFFGEKLNEAARRFTQLKNDVEFYQKAEERAKAKSGKSKSNNNHGSSGTNGVRRRISGNTSVSPTKFLRIGATKTDKNSIKTIKELKLACTEFYLNLVLIQNYQELNFTGFRKILKKHDKLMESTSGAEWREKHVESAPFYTNKQISNFISQTEAIFINDLEGGDRSKAMKRLRVPPLDKKTKDYPRGVVFRVGLFTGMCIISVAALILSLNFYTPLDDINNDNIVTTIKLFRPGFLLCLFMLFIGINIWGWRTAGVNHVLIFEIDPREHLSHQHILEIAAWLTLLLLFSILCFIYDPIPKIIPPYAYPVILYSFIALFLILPKVPGCSSYYKARMWLLTKMKRLLVAPYYPVEFADFWLADQMNSLAAVIMDLEYLICFFSFDGNFTTGLTTTSTAIVGNGTHPVNISLPTNSSGRAMIDMTYEVLEDRPVCGQYKYGVRLFLACWPALIRFLQCARRYYDSKKAFPHLYNAGKYSTTFFKVGFTALFYEYADSDTKTIWFSLWLVSTIVSSCYTLWWDLKMDWGFLESNEENTLLREEIVYSYPIYYYLAILQDVLLRFAWSIEFYLKSFALSSPIHKEIISTVFKSLEVFRRFIWNFFRLENEHLNNCGEFRAVRDISINPLREEDLPALMRMMDLDDGVTNRRSDPNEEQERRLSAYGHQSSEAHPLLHDSGLETN